MDRWIGLARTLFRLIPPSGRGWLWRRPAVQRLRYRVMFPVLSARLRRQLAEPSKSTLDCEKPYQGIRVLLPLIESSHYKALQLLTLAKALQIRGASVRVLVCGQTLTACEIRSVLRNNDTKPCWRCEFNERHLLPLFGLDYVTLADVLGGGVSDDLANISDEWPATADHSSKRYGIDLDRCIEDSVVRHYHGAPPPNEEEVAAVRRRHVRTASMSLEAARRLHLEYRPDVVLGYMAAYSEWEPFYLYFPSQGVPFRLVSSTQFDVGAQQVHWPEVHKSKDRFERYLSTRATRFLSEAEKAELTRFRDRRRTGSAEVFQKLGFFDGARDNAPPDMGIDFDPAKRNLVLFSNIFWDVGSSDMGGLYPDILSWVIDTVEIMRGQSDCHLYIKTHPGEKYDSSPSHRGVADVVREACPVLPPNVSFVDPSLRVNTYELFPYVDLGVVFNGTVGLEMLLSGTPVVTTGTAPYDGMGFTHDPSTREEYERVLLGQVPDPELDRDELELFAFFYFIRTSIPWRLTKNSWAAGDADGIELESLEDLMPGKDPLLDHLCACIADPENTVPEAWPTPRHEGRG